MSRSRARAALLLLLPACSTAPAPTALPADDAEDARAAPPDAAAPGRAPLGATVSGGGVEFRVWAPGATAAAVSGDFSPGAAVPLRPEGGGVFGGRVDGARAGQHYRYLLTAKDGQQLARLDPYARQIDGAESVIVDPARYPWRSAPFARPGKNAVVVYELHPGSFGCPDGPASCGFAGIAARLPELQDLGVNAIELMPPNAHGSTRGWGYNPQAYFAPHASYGAPDDLRGLVDAAHERGVAVLLDMVYNHYDGWKRAPLYCFDGVCPDGTYGPYFFSDAMYRLTPWGPRFDYARPEVAEFIVDNVRSWRAEYRVDGLRWDSAANIRAIDGRGSVPGGVALLRRANAAAREAPGALLIAEDLKGEAAVTARDGDGLGFDAQWDGGFYWALTSAVLAADDGGRDVGAVRDALKGSYNGDPFQRLLYTETHDTAGNSGAYLPSRIDPADPGSWAARKRSMLAAGVLLTAPGVPMLFQGQEMLAAGKFADPPEPLDWSRRQAQAPVVSFYRDLVRLRRNLEGKTPGLLGSNVDVFHVHAQNKVLAYRRWAVAGEDTVVITNFAGRRYARYDVGLPQGGTWRVRVNSDDTRYSADFGGASSADVAALDAPRDGLPFTGPIALGPYALVVLSR